MRKTERLHAIVKQLAIRENCYSVQPIFTFQCSECPMPKSWAWVDCFRQISLATFLGHSTDICLLLVLLYHIRLCVSTPFLKLFSGRFYPDTYACTSTIEKSLLLYLNCLAQVQHCLTQDTSRNIAQSYTRHFIYLAQVAQLHTFLFCII